MDIIKSSDVSTLSVHISCTLPRHARIRVGVTYPRTESGPWSGTQAEGARFSLPRWGPRGYAAKRTCLQRIAHSRPALGVQVWQVHPRLSPGPCSSARSGRSRGSLGLSLGLLGSLGSPPANPTLPTSASFSCPQPPQPFFFLLPKGHDRIVMRSTITMCVVGNEEGGAAVRRTR